MQVMVFYGSYHGSVFMFANGTADPVNAPFDYVMADYNDCAGTFDASFSTYSSISVGSNRSMAVQSWRH